MTDLNGLAKTVHSIAIKKGWYEGRTREFPELIALMHSELSEALEEWRDGQPSYYLRPSGETQKPEGYGVELADAIIRILDCCAFMDVDIDRAIEQKIAYNRTRPYRHGGKRA